MSTNTVRHRPQQQAQQQEAVDAAAAAASAAVDGASSVYGSRTSSRSRARKRLLLEQKLQVHMDVEDRRVKNLTEGVLYDFLPAALSVMMPNCEEQPHELDADRCRAVASAALAVSCLMNAPPGFLEFLLCVPWRKLSQLVPKPDSIDQLISHLHVTDDERKRLVNTRLERALLPIILDFLYRFDHVDSVPPLLQLTSAATEPSLPPEEHEHGVVTLETVAALLDGATPLHCAALRGNPAAVDHLLYCGANPTLRTAAGELAIELVPVCGDRSSGGGVRSCRCMGQNDQEVWECRSRLARSLIARRCVLSLGIGLIPWVQLLIFCLMCMLGRRGCHTSICRPGIEEHMVHQRDSKRHEAQARAQGLIERMRSEAAAGRAHLEHAKIVMPPPVYDKVSPLATLDAALGAALAPPTSSFNNTLMPNSYNSGTNTVGLSPSSIAPDSTDNSIAYSFATAAYTSSTSTSDLQTLMLRHHGASTTSRSATHERSSEKAFQCFVRAVHALQGLDLQGDTVPHVFADSLGLQHEAPELHDTHVLEDEQADLFCCWAESVLLKFRACKCAACAALAAQAVRMAHLQASRLFARMEKHRREAPDRWLTVGQALARVVYTHICLLLETEAQVSPTRASVWRAEQCLTEWAKLSKAELTQGPATADQRQVDALQLWARTADSDLYVAEAIMGSPLTPSQTLQEVIAATVCHSPRSQLPHLTRPMTPDTIDQLEQALTLACHPSPRLTTLAHALISSGRGEFQAAARLRQLVGVKPGQSAASMLSAVSLSSAAVLPSGGAGGQAAALAALAAAIHAAEVYPRLSAEVAAARELQGRWVRRVQAVEQLDTVVERARADSAAHPITPAAIAALLAQRAQQEKLAAAAGAAGVMSAQQAAAGSNSGSHAQFSHSSDDRQQGASSLALSRSDSSSSSRKHAGGLVDSSGGGDSSKVAVAWEQRVQELEAAVNEAKDANISVNKARKLLKELNAQYVAADAARQLSMVLGKRPAGPGALKAALAKAETAASGLSGVEGSPVQAEMLLPLVQVGRKRLDVERAAELLNKAASTCKAVADLPKLEAAILNARKVGAEELDPDSYKHASDMRARLHEASKVRAALDAAVKALQRQLRSEDAQAVENVLQGAGKWEELLGNDVSRARESLDQWRSVSTGEAKLARALQEGAGTEVLSRAIQEASAAGIKVAAAKRVLKLMQGLEAAVAAVSSGSIGSSQDGSAAGGGSHYSLLKARLDAAEAGGVPASMLQSGRRALRRLMCAEVQEALEAALHRKSDSSIAQSVAALTEVLQRADAFLSEFSSESPTPQASATHATDTAHSTPSSTQIFAAQSCLVTTADSGAGNEHGSSSTAHVHGSGAVAGGSLKTRSGSSAYEPPDCASDQGSVCGTTASVSRADSAVHAEEDACIGVSSGPVGSGLHAEANSIALAQGLASAAAQGGGAGLGAAAVALKHCLQWSGSGRSDCSSIAESDADNIEHGVGSIRQLCQKARELLLEHQATMAQLEAKRLAAEQARLQAQQHEREERLRAEQERAEKNRESAAERDKALAAKRAAAKQAQEARIKQQQQLQLQQQQYQQQQQQQKEQAAVTAAAAAAAAAASAAVAAPPSKAKAGSTASIPPARSAAGSVGLNGGGRAGGRGVTAAPTGRRVVGAPIPASPAAVIPAAPTAPPAPPHAASVAKPAISTAPDFDATAFQTPSGAAVVCPSDPAAPVLTSLPPTIFPQKPTFQSAPCTVRHSRGDSLESLGEATLRLNRDMLEALDEDEGPLPSVPSPTPAGAAQSAALVASSWNTQPTTLHTHAMSQALAEGADVTGGGCSAGAASLYGMRSDGPTSQPASSRFSSATSTDEVLGFSGCAGSSAAASDPVGDCKTASDITHHGSNGAKFEPQPHWQQQQQFQQLQQRWQQAPGEPAPSHLSSEAVAPAMWPYRVAAASSIPSTDVLGILSDGGVTWRSHLNVSSNCQHQQQQPQSEVGATAFEPASAGLTLGSLPQSSSRPRLVFADLGGASWGVDSGASALGTTQSTAASGVGLLSGVGLSTSAATLPLGGAATESGSARSGSGPASFFTALAECSSAASWEADGKASWPSGTGGPFGGAPVDLMTQADAGRVHQSLDLQQRQLSVQQQQQQGMPSSSILDQVLVTGGLTALAAHSYALSPSSATPPMPLQFSPRALAFGARGSGEVAYRPTIGNMVQRSGVLTGNWAEELTLTQQVAELQQAAQAQHNTGMGGFVADAGSGLAQATVSNNGSGGGVCGSGAGQVSNMQTRLGAAPEAQAQIIGGGSWWDAGGVSADTDVNGGGSGTTSADLLLLFLLQQQQQHHGLTEAAAAGRAAMWPQLQQQHQRQTPATAGNGSSAGCGHFRLGADQLLHLVIPHDAVAGTQNPPTTSDDALLSPDALRSCRPCRFWVQGYCRDGDHCRFLHDPPPTASNHPVVGLSQLQQQQQAGSLPPSSSRTALARMLQQQKQQQLQQQLLLPESQPDHGRPGAPRPLGTPLALAPAAAATASRGMGLSALAGVYTPGPGPDGLACSGGSSTPEFDRAGVRLASAVVSFGNSRSQTPAPFDGEDVAAALSGVDSGWSGVGGRQVSLQQRPGLQAVQQVQASHHPTLPDDLLSPASSPRVFGRSATLSGW